MAISGFKNEDDIRGLFNKKYNDLSLSAKTIVDYIFEDSVNHDDFVMCKKLIVDLKLLVSVLSNFNSLRLNGNR